MLSGMSQVMCLHLDHHLDLHPMSIKHALPISDTIFSSNTTLNIHFTIAFAFLSSKILHPVSPLISSFITFHTSQSHLRIHICIGSDTVPYQRLLRLIYSLGVQGIAIDSIRAFLTGRRKKVRVNRSYSTCKNVISGVPQGFVLGQMLFTLWDAPQVVKCIVSMFADDTKLYTVLTDHNSNLKLNNDLASMQTWSSRMQMTFNTKKCKVLDLGSNNPNHLYTMPMSGENVHTLEVTIDEKDLG